MNKEDSLVRDVLIVYVCGGGCYIEYNKDCKNNQTDKTN
jgi:hypothetical protein